MFQIRHAAGNGRYRSGMAPETVVPWDVTVFSWENFRLGDKSFLFQFGGGQKFGFRLGGDKSFTGFQFGGGLVSI